MAALVYTLGAILLRPFLVIQPTRGLARAAYVLLRSHLGRHHASFVGIVELLVVVVVFGLWLAVIRGLTTDTAASWFFDMWITLPLAVVFCFLFVWWGVRTLGVGQQELGPLHNNAAHSNFTGHQAQFWPKFGLLDEWHVLSRLEPALIALAGVVLLSFPFTRAAGLLLIAVSVADAVHTWRDFHVNRQEDDSMPSDESAEVILPRAAYKVERSTEVEVPVEPSQRPGGGFRPHGAPRAVLREKIIESEVVNRGLRSARFSFDVVGWMALVTAVLMFNLIKGDPVGIYTHAPASTVLASESIGRELDVLGLDERTPEGVYSLTASILQRHDPNAITALQAERTQAVSDDVYEGLQLARRQLENERRHCLEDLPGELSNPPGDAAMHRLFLENETAAEDFAVILNGLAEAERQLAVLVAAHSDAEAAMANQKTPQAERPLQEIKRQIPSILERLENVRLARERLLEQLNDD